MDEKTNTGKPKRQQRTAGTSKKATPATKSSKRGSASADATPVKAKATRKPAAKRSTSATPGRTTTRRKTAASTTTASNASTTSRRSGKRGTTSTSTTKATATPAKAKTTRKPAAKRATSATPGRTSTRRKTVAKAPNADASIVKKSTPTIKVEKPKEDAFNLKSLSDKKKKKYQKLVKSLAALNGEKGKMTTGLYDLIKAATLQQVEALEKIKEGADPKKRTKLIKNLDKRITAIEIIEKGIAKIASKIVKAEKKLLKLRK